ncbi:2-phospho-L-lactate guanylyltransferase [Streptomyces sp. NPDC056672]|uniref:2-phospho-L-lactate guanylyltransferase n=1 Tax=Streptomyces sp. NPDC056672 TaxID=3345906 RepID=UPI0036C60F6E
MEETISRMTGSRHGSYRSVSGLEAIAKAAGRSETVPTDWTVLLPVKPFHRAKSRLRCPDPGIRAALARAFFRDTLDAVLATPGVGAVLVVTSDGEAAADARAAGAGTVPDRLSAGLNAAIGTAAAEVLAAGASGPVAVLTADLPALRSAELGEVLAAAARHPRAFLADQARRGTTLLAAGRAQDLAPSFEDASRARHRRSGAYELTYPAAPSVRLDVDTLDDLRAAHALGTGRHTRPLIPEALGGGGAVRGTTPTPR